MAVLNAVVLSMMAVVFVVGKLLYAKHGGEFNEEKVESDKLIGRIRSVKSYCYYYVRGECNTPTYTIEFL